MAMTACYRNFDIPQISQSVSHSNHLVTNHQARHHTIALQPLQTSAATALSPALPQLSSQPSIKKDYNIPLHVDCSVEYELPNQAKPPVGTRVEPLLMIHPCYFRKMESQRRSPFINNMPNQQTSHINHNNSNTNSSNINRQLRQHTNASSARQHSHITPSTSHHHNQISDKNNLQLPCSTLSTASSASKIRSSHYQPQINLQQQIDEYVQRHIVQMSVPPPPSVTYSTMNNSHNNSQHSSQSNSNTNSNNNNNNHYPAQQSQRAPSTWDPYSITNLGQQQQKLMQCHNIKQASYISNSNNEGGGLLCTGRWSDVIEKTSSLAAIPRDYQSGPECIPIKTAVTNQTSANIYRNTVGKRDAMLSGGCNIYSSDNTAAEISLSTVMWKPDKAATSSRDQLEPNNMNTKVSKSSSSNNNISSLTSNTNLQNNHNYNNHSSFSVQVAQAAQDHRHLLSGKYKQYLRSQRMHPYSMLPGSMTGAVSSGFPQLSSTSTMFQQVSCYNV